MNVERFDPRTSFTPAEMAEVRERSNFTGLLCIAHAWIVIGCAMALFALWPNPLSFLLAVFVIGSRQLGLAVLMHDAAHGILLRSKTWNDRLSQWLLAWPVFNDTFRYRDYHLVHHRTTQQPDDPDLVLSAPFPITRASFRRKMFRDFTGQTGFKQRTAQLKAAFAIGKPDMTFGARLKNFWNRMGGMVIANLVLLGILAALGHPVYYLTFWLLPLLTWQQVITRIRNIAEHAMVPDNDDVMRNARTTYAGFFTRAFIAPYWVNYHVDHHLLMYVPCYHLEKLHALLLAKGFGPKMEIRRNYAAMLELAVSREEEKPQQPEKLAA